MTPSLLPFNIDLLNLSNQDVKTLHQIKVLDIFDGFSRNFHPQGLFSTEIFGKVGEERRNRLFAYIDMKIPIFHPVLFKAITNTKSLYGEILAGKSFAIFDPDLKDFIKKDALSGMTGYSFFVSHFKDLHYEERPSVKREFNIKLLYKYKETALMDKLIVMPAGLRDYEIDDNNKPTEDEINGMYRKVLSIAGVADGIDIKTNESYLDSTRYNLQLVVNGIYDYIVSMLEGKHKLILGKWASRKIFNSTRNVISPYIPNVVELHGDRTVSTTQTVVGLYQFLRATLPLSVKNIRDNYLSDVFVGSNSPAVMVNKTTLKKERVDIDPSYYDEWMTFEGLEGVAARFGQEDLRHEYLEIKNHYFGLIYKGPGVFKFFQDIDDLPDPSMKKDVYPITFAELLYISVFRGANEVPCLFTRYPITGYGSIYPSYIYLKTTVKSDIRIELDESWQPKEGKAMEFPVKDKQFFNSMAPSLKHLGRLGADKK